MRQVRIAASIPLAALLAVLPASSLGGAWVSQDQLAPTPVSPAPSAEMRALIRDRLGRAMASRARIVLQREIVFLGILKNSKALLQRAIELSPDNPSIWRLALDLASILEDGDPDAERWLSQGLSRLSQLEPDDEVVRLRRILDAISRKRTAEERVAASEAMLTPDAVKSIGPGVAARIAFDLAMLQRRTGDAAGFERNLVRTLDLDPYFSQAAEVAAGYFRMTAPTLLDEVRALRLAMLANPTRTNAATGLAEVCMAHGAYAAAADVLGVQVRLQDTSSIDENYDALLADYLLALWASGRAELAIMTARERQRELDIIYIAEIERQGMQMTQEERANLHLPLPTPLATAVAAISESIGSTSAKVAVGNAQVSFEAVIDQVTRRKGDRSLIASTALECAWVQLWLGGSVDKAQSMISKSADQGPLSDAARARFDGWIAFRKQEVATAKSLLEPIAATDLYARLGLAMVREAEGDKKECARLLLDVARSAPATAVGIWARERLFGILGKRAGLFPESDAVEAAAAMPAEFVRVVQLGGDAMQLRIVPSQESASAWDQVRFDLELINRCEWPLAVSPDGPLKDSATISASINIPGEMPRPPQIIILPIDRAFVIYPGETLRVPIDLSVTDASAALRDDALSGALVSLHSIVNWKTSATGFEPSPLGIEVESPVVHIEGEKVTKEWVEQSLAQLRDPAQAPNPELVALLAGALVRKSATPEMVPADAAESLAQAGPVLADAATRMWPEARAWLIFATPKGKRIEQGKEAQDLLDVVAAGGVELASAVPELEALDAVLRSDESPTVRIPWIAVRTRRPEDPTLIASLESKDPDVRAYAADCKQWLIEARDERAKQLNLKK